MADIMKKYETVIERVSNLINNGTLKEGDKLPSVRQMAQQMSLGIMTVLDAYRRMEARGLIESLPRSGYIVRPPSLQKPANIIKLPEARIGNITVQEKTVQIPAEVEELFRAVVQPDMVALGAGLPDPGDLPSEELSLALARAARTWPMENNQYYLGFGDQQLATELGKWMVNTGCSPLPDEITITQGITQALNLALRAISKPGDTILVESPGYYGFYTILEYLNLKAVEVPVEPSCGISIPELTKILKKGVRPKALICSPTFSNPTGAVIPGENRQKLIELSQKYNFIIIEDDTYGELYFSSHRPFPPLKALAPEDIIYLGSFSKLFAPGYRIGWAAAGRYTDDLRRCYSMAILASPPVLQKAVADYLKRGGVRQHLRRLREKYHNNTLTFQGIIAESFPEGTRTADPAGGHYLWLELPKKCDAVAITREAMKQKVSAAPGVLFSSRRHYKNYMRLNCGLKCTEKVINAIKTIGKLAKEDIQTSKPQISATG